MKLTGKAWVAGLAGVLASLLGQGTAAIAAEKIVLTYGPISMRVPITELEGLAETGEASGQLEQLLKLANQEPTSVQTTLTDPVPVNLTVLDLALNSLPGEWALDQVGEIIHPASGAGSRQALRSALIAAAADDNEITLLEVMQAYPTPELMVRGDRLLETYNRLYDILEPLEALADIFETDILP
ncbi:alpha/beta hydrolase [Leptolyngbya iicbica]|uniref:Alpha/beta hydrolase n=2 Tax=Cyanophyceae TaxID=3028117 RepID=A0A4Q7EH61_9CYAN|nr:alpha/beta hydrolase [Leptolyngbya sp. LK]RZM82447.1 alpha/beta hydrolase [Leptolyngbya sp. LK]